MIIPEGFAQVNLKFGGSGQPLGAEMSFGIDVSGTSETPVEIAEAIRLLWASAQVNFLQCNSTSLQSVLVKFGPNDTGPSAEFTSILTGTDTRPQLTPQVALLVSKNTAAGGRSGRGRFYLPGIPEADVDAGGRVAPSFVGTANDKFEDFMTGLNTLGIPMVLLHSAAAGIPITTPLEVTSLTVQTQVGTQRRRNRR